ncbi:aspartic endopeptidase [Ophiostoma piceae UAMH 11346]|uniref:Aspartic endopeptidase n=1 Tax=Ophiostoma piceae (strain UAMH 11346) TaxID=1262450 RepID=S3D4A5_OPHP1|nr:aspartic endopeptidase [Ophiostoma piceae UAMH 11346]
MQRAFMVQQEVKASLGLKKISVKVNDKFKHNGTRQYAKAVKKYNFKPTRPGPYAGLSQCGLVQQGKQLLSSKSTSDGTGKDPAEDQQDLLYIAEVDIGTPPQKLMLDFDTGSADLWVFSTDLAKNAKKNHTVFDASKSSSFKKSSSLRWKISYGDGSTASGNVGTDVVSIGGLPIQNQAVELASTLSDQFLQSPSDGLLGLAWSSINTITKNHLSSPQPTPVENLISSKTLPQDAQLFTSCFYSTRDANSESFYTLGYVDQDLVKSSGKEIVWTDIDNKQGFWMFPSTTATINGQKIDRSGNTAIADTGTTLCLISDEAVEALYKTIPGSKYDDAQGGYMIPTTTAVDKLPTFSIAVGTNEFVIQKEDIIFGDAQDGYWFGGVQSRGENPFDILGDVFLKSIYAIWDQGNVRFGAVPKIQPTQNLGDGSGSSSAQ